jgi:hypothetical protein
MNKYKQIIAHIRMQIQPIVFYNFVRVGF